MEDPDEWQELTIPAVMLEVWCILDSDSKKSCPIHFGHVGYYTGCRNLTHNLKTFAVWTYVWYDLWLFVYIIIIGLYNILIIQFYFATVHFPDMVMVPPPPPLGSFLSVDSGELIWWCLRFYGHMQLWGCFGEGRLADHTHAYTF